MDLAVLSKIKTRSARQFQDFTAFNIVKCKKLLCTYLQIWNIYSSNIDFFRGSYGIIIEKRPFISYACTLIIISKYSWFHIKCSWSVHSFNGDYLSIPSTHRYSPLHKTLPKTSLQMHWTSVRFYETVVRWRKLFHEIPGN